MSMMVTSETRRQRFTRLAPKRVEAAEEALRKLGNLSNTAYYEYTREDIDQIVERVLGALGRVDEQFTRKLAKRR